jgi:hypothetical protein
MQESRGVRLPLMKDGRPLLGDTVNLARHDFGLLRILPDDSLLLLILCGQFLYHFGNKQGKRYEVGTKLEEFL